MKASRGEIKIFDILTAAGLNFEEEYSNVNSRHIR